MAVKKAAKQRPSARPRKVKKKVANQPAAQGTGERLIAPPGGVTVRMYRQGLGDCFLLAFGGQVDSKHQPRQHYVLIDCGVHSRQDDGPPRLRQVMEDIEQATGGEIDVVVATHEHADHLSGMADTQGPFVQKNATGKPRLRITEFWVGWTEQVGNPQADRLRRKRGATRAALDKAMAKLQAAAEKAQAQALKQNAKKKAAKKKNAPDEPPEPHEVLRGLLDFERMPGSSDLGMQGKGQQLAAGHVNGKLSDKASSNAVALELLKTNSKRVRYCNPGEVRTLPGNDQVRVYVLGPPRDEDLLSRDLELGAKHDPDRPDRETYLSGGRLEQTFLSSPALHTDDDQGDAPQLPLDARYPFDADKRQRVFDRPSDRPSKKTQEARYWEPQRSAATQQFYQEQYLGSANDWQRIDGDWMGVAEQLALNLDSDTNNTSLVLAFECGAQGKGRVLLFVGDAQVGNWLSWRTVDWKGVKPAPGENLGDELMKRTVLYKVGHHGSHNATIKQDPDHKSEEHPQGAPCGLELMPTDLVAMIPVDQTAARKKMPIPWHMPHPPLYRRLLEKADGRVLRSDGQAPTVGELPKGAKLRKPKSEKFQDVPGVAHAKWRVAKQKFKDGRKCELFYDVQFETLT